MGLGYGTVAYFNFHWYMIILFVIIVGLTLPSIWLFTNFEGGD